MAPPAAPSNLTAHPATASRVELAWSDNSSDEVNFELERSPNGTTGWTLINSPAANVTTYSNTGLDPNVTYYWRIRAVNADGNSAYSATASALTLNPGRAPITPRMYLWQPETVFAARVNLASATYPIDHFDVDGITTGAITDARAGMTILIGSAPGLDDYGRQRIRKDGSGSTLFVGRSSRGTHDGELTVTNDAYITVWDDRRLWAKIPHIAPPVAGVSEIFKDSDLEVGDRTTNPPPVAVMGRGFAGTIDADTEVITVLFNGQPSFAVADGATITDFLWNIKDGTLTAGTLTDDNITATFPAGRRYVELTVTDSNGNSHTTARPVYARDPANDTSFAAFDIEPIRVTDQGQTVTVRILEDMPRATYPDGTLALIWEFEPTGAADRNHMLMIGWLDTEDAQIGRTKTGVLRDTKITILDVAAKLDTLPGFSQAIADDATRDTEKIPAITWNYMIAPTLHKYIHYLLHWHSTALEVADFIWSDSGDDYPFVLLASDGDSLWNQVDRRARAFDPDRVLTCDRAGGIAVVPDPMIAAVADRTAVVQAAIDESEYSDIRFVRKRSPTVHWLRGGAILAGTTQPIQTVFGIAPGDTPGQGLGEVMHGEKLTLSQAVFNISLGNHYARKNAPFGYLILTLVQDDGGPGSVVPWREIEPAWKQWVTVDLSAEFAAQRGWTFTTVRGLPRELAIRYNRTKTGTARTLELTVELETVGEPGTTVIKPVVPPVGEDPLETVPPDFGLIDGQEMVAGIGIDGYVYRTSDFQTVSGSGGPTWDRVDTTIADTIYSFVVDPFSPAYIAGSGAVNGWVVNDTDIYRVTDLFGTPVATSVHTFPVATSGAAFHWRSIQASFGAYFAEGANPWLLCVSYYGATAGHTGTWAKRSTDGGVTWEAEVQISAFYDDGIATRFNPIGVYASPRTPGLAYTVAHIEIASPALTDGYISTDWGATWTRVSGAIVDDPAHPAPVFGEWPNGGALAPNAPGGGYAGFVKAEEVGSVPGVDEDEMDIIIIPPATTKRMVVSGRYTSTNVEIGLSSGATSILSLHNAGTVGRTDDLSYVGATSNNTVTGSFTAEWTFTGGNWPVNLSDYQSSPPGAATAAGARINLFTNANASGGATPEASCKLSVVLSVVEIELDNGQIYRPPVSGPGMIQTGHLQAGSITIPWNDNTSEQLALYGYADLLINRQFRLKSASGTTITDISPDDGTRSYGINRYGFSIRALDSNRQHLLMSGIGNDTSADPDDDWHAVYISANYGSSWTQVVAPIADSGAPAGRPAFEAAFSPSDENTYFIWGPAEYISYTDSGVAGLDDRSGNLSSFSPSGWIGIAGGST